MLGGMLLVARLLCLLAIASGCALDFALPPPPSSGARHRLTGFTPQEGFTGATIRVTGAGFGRRADDVEVRFGQSASVRPGTVADVSLDVIVPVDATTGPISVSVGGARVATGSAFTFRGVGYLRHGRVRASVDLRPQIHAAFPFGTKGTLAALAVDLIGTRRTFHDLLLFVGPLTLESLGAEVRAMVPAGDDALGVLDDLFNEDDCGHLRRVTLDAWDVPEERKVGLHDSLLLCGGRMQDVAFDPTGLKAVAVSSSTAWAVDFTPVTPVARELGVAEGSFSRVKWVGNGRFLVVEGSEVRPVVVSALLGGWRMDAATDLFPAEGALIADLAFGWSDHVALLYTDGVIAVAQVSTWPPAAPGTTIRPARPLQHSVDRRIAMAPDSPRVAMVRPEVDTVLIYDVTSGAPQAAVPLPSPRLATATSDGQLYVGILGGVAVLSMNNGVELDRIRVSADLRTPRLREQTFTTFECGDLPDKMLSVASRTFNTLVNLDPCTLETAYMDDRFPEPRIESIAASPDKPEVFALHQQQAPRGPAVGGVEPHRAVRTIFSGQESTDAIVTLTDVQAYEAHNFAVSPDGLAVILHYRPDSIEETGDKVAVIDFARQRLALTFDAQAKISLAQADGSGHLALVDEPPFDIPQPPARATILDLAAALEGRTAFIGPEPAALGGWRLLAGVVAGSRLYASLIDADELRMVDLATGTVTSGTNDAALDVLLGLVNLGPVSPAGRIWIAASPSGRRVWALSETGEQVRLLAQILDPDAGTFGSQDQLVPLPKGAREMYPYPDGENLVVLDSAEDQMLLLE